MFSTAAWCSGARRVADQRNRRSAGCRGVGETGFEVGDAPVLEAQGGAGGFEAFVEGAVVGGELPDALFECGVLGGDALDRILSPLGFQVSDAAEEFSDTRALGEDFGDSCTLMSHVVSGRLHHHAGKLLGRPDAHARPGSGCSSRPRSSPSTWSVAVRTPESGHRPSRPSSRHQCPHTADAPLPP